MISYFAHSVFADAVLAAHPWLSCNLLWRIIHLLYGNAAFVS